MPSDHCFFRSRHAPCAIALSIICRIVAYDHATGGIVSQDLIGHFDSGVELLPPKVPAETQDHPLRLLPKELVHV